MDEMEEAKAKAPILIADDQQQSAETQQQQMERNRSIRELLESIEGPIFRIL